MSGKSPRTIQSSSAEAFSLVELLVVVAIILLLGSLSILAFDRIGQSRAVTKAGADLMGILESARAYAMSESTYVWVDLQCNQDDLKISVKASRNGEKSPPAADVIFIQPSRTYRNIRVAKLDTATGRPLIPEDCRLQIQNGSLRTLQFNRRGELQYGAAAPTKAIEIGLLQSVNGAPHNLHRYAAVQARGLSGSISLYQP